MLSNYMVLQATHLVNHLNSQYFIQKKNYASFKFKPFDGVYYKQGWSSRFYVLYKFVTLLSNSITWVKFLFCSNLVYLICFFLKLLNREYSQSRNRSRQVWWSFPILVAHPKLQLLWKELTEKVLYDCLLVVTIHKGRVSVCSLATLASHTYYSLTPWLI